MKAEQSSNFEVAMDEGCEHLMTEFALSLIKEELLPDIKEAQKEEFEIAS